MKKFSINAIDGKYADENGNISYNLPKLHSTEKKLKFVMYWPRLSPNMDWWKELDQNMFTWTDISNDLDQIKAELGVNAVRVFTYYDHQFRQTGTLGWTDGFGNHNSVRLAQLKQFIELADSKGLDVVITMYQLLPALTPTDNWNFLENDIAHYISFHTWLLNGIKNYKNVVSYNLINEPDGYGVFGDTVLGGRVLIFLNTLRKTGKTIAPNLLCIVNATTHDNSFRRFPGTSADATSIYDITDVLAHNSFRWADTGDWPGTNFQTQLAYLNAKNVLNKPIAMMECGFPANYAQQSVSGYPSVNESGIPTGGNATITEESIVPQGNIFNRPFGVSTGLAHTSANQVKSVGEAIAMAERYDLDGLGAWSAFDHYHPTASYVYRDPFGLIDRDGVVLPAGKIFKYALTERFPYDLKHKLSLSSGTVGGDARINGLGGYNTADITKNTPNGVYLGVGGSYWNSEALAVSFPTKIVLNFTIRTAYTHQEPMIISILTNGKQLDFRYKVYGVNSWQRLEATSADIDRGWASNSPVLGVGNHSLMIDFSTVDLSPTITIDGILLDYSASGIEPFDLWMLADGFRIVVRNNSDSPIDIKEMFAQGTTEGESVTMNREFAKPIVRKELVPRKL
jgi:Cellulase (glycosyl hydrolase family 5)